MKKITSFVVLLLLLLGVENANAQNNCLDFDGIDDYAATTNTINLNITNNITLEAWIYVNSFPTGAYDITSIIGEEDPTNGTAILRLGDPDPTVTLANNKLQFVLSFYSSGSLKQYKLNGSTALDINTWYHVAATFKTGTIDAHIYINGIEDGIGYLGNETNFVANDKFYIGAIFSPSTRFIDGKIDEVRVWSTAKTVTEIRNSMYKELIGTETGLIAYYKLNESSGTIADNAEGTAAYDATLYGSMTDADWVTSPAFEGPKNCLYLHGGLQSGSPDYAYKTSNVTVNTDNFTMMAWFKADVITSGASWRCIAYNGDDGGGWGIGISNSKVSGLFGTTLWATTTEVLTTGKWYHLTMRRSSGTVQFFLNGKLLSYSNTTSPLTPNAKFCIGNMYNADGTTIYGDSFNGQIDEVRVYDAALSAQQIREAMCNALVGDEANLVGYYNFDNSTGTKLQSFDGSGTGNDLTLVNTTNTDWVSSTAFNSWLNVTNTTWETATNWSSGSVPSATDNVGITYTGGSYPTCSGVVASPSLCNNLSVATSASLDINVGKALTVSGNLFNYGTTTINSDATGTGSLIINGTATGDVTVERFLTHDRWHYISGQTNISGNFSTLTMGLTGGANKDQFYRWEESLSWGGNIGNWVDILNGPDGNNSTMSTEGFVACKGYAVNYITTDKTLSLSGVPYVASKTIAIDKTVGSTAEGSNLIGNPFSSTIAINSSADATNYFLGDNGSTVLNPSYSAVYLWNESSSWDGSSNADYVTIDNLSSATFLAPGQAFMVMAASDAVTVNFNTSIRKHGSATFYKNSTADNALRFELFVKDADNIGNSTSIAFMPDMTLGLDPSYDAGKLKGNPKIALYTHLVESNGIDFGTQALPNDDIKSIVIPVGIDVAEGILCEFSVKPEALEGYPVYLVDTKENTATNLKEHSYTTLVSESGVGRFFLHFAEISSIIEPTTQIQLIQVWTSNNTINIFNKENLSGDVKVLNMFGQVILKTQLNGDSNQQLIINSPSGYYIVNIVTNKGVVNKKVYLR